MEYEVDLEELNKELRKEVILSKVSKLETMVDEFVISEIQDQELFMKIKKLQSEIFVMLINYLFAYSKEKEFIEVHISNEDCEFCSNINEKCVDLTLKALEQLNENNR